MPRRQDRRQRERGRVALHQRDEQFDALVPVGQCRAGDHIRARRVRSTVRSTARHFSDKNSNTRSSRPVVRTTPRPAQRADDFLAGRADQDTVRTLELHLRHVLGPHRSCSLPPLARVMRSPTGLLRFERQIREASPVLKGCWSDWNRGARARSGCRAIARAIARSGFDNLYPIGEGAGLRGWDHERGHRWCACREELSSKTHALLDAGRASACARSSAAPFGAAGHQPVQFGGASSTNSR